MIAGLIKPDDDFLLTGFNAVWDGCFTCCCCDCDSGFDCLLVTAGPLATVDEADEEEAVSVDTAASKTAFIRIISIPDL